jgi:DNA uptake protein ComE-like DNA-binding protein
VVTGLLFMAHAGAAGLRGGADEARGRALAWSGVQAVMEVLDRQRLETLDAELPRVDRQYVIYEDGTRAGVVRLLPVTPGGDLLVPEAGRIDLNGVQAEGLAATGRVEAALAEAIVKRRDAAGRPFQSVAELLQVPGIDPELMYGPLEELTISDDLTFEQADVAERVAGLHQGQEPRGLADLVTVYAWEPAVQRDGARRINLNQPWSEELSREISARFGPEAAEFMSAVFAGGTKFQSEADIIKALRSGLEPAEWPEYLDAFTTDAGALHFGRMDINTAPLEALLALPGIDRQRAALLVQVRETLSLDELATVAWPAVRGILPPEAYDELASLVTTRCWTFRARLAAGEVDEADLEGPLRQPIVYEAVFDLAASPPRVAYLRDITLLETTALIASGVPASDEDDAEEFAADEPAGGEHRGEEQPLDDEEGAADEPSGAAPADEEPADDAPPGGPPAAETPPADAPSDPAPAEPAPAPSRQRIGRWRARRAGARTHPPPHPA